MRTSWTVGLAWVAACGASADADPCANIRVPATVESYMPALCPPNGEPPVPLSFCAELVPSDPGVDPPAVTCHPSGQPVEVDDVGFPDLQSGLNAAASGAHVTLCPGTYVGSFTSAVPIELIGNQGAAVIVLDAKGAGTVLTLAPGSTVRGVTLRGGSATVGGGLVLDGVGDFEIEASVVTGNHATDGGGVWVGPGTTVSFPCTTIRDNDADRGGGLYAAADAVLDLADATVTNNTAFRSGGGLHAEAGLDLDRGTFTANVVTSDDPADGGGGLFVHGPGSLLPDLVAENVSTRGAGIRVVASGDMFVGGLVRNNDATASGTTDGWGGGLYAGDGASTVQADHSFWAVGNTATRGGGLFVTDGVHADGGVALCNQATYGGGVYVRNAMLHITYIAQNTADSGGGGIVLDGTFDVDGLDIRWNTAIDGGGIFVATSLPEATEPGDIFVGDGNLQGNVAEHGGGAWISMPERHVSFDPSVRGNRATKGGGLYVSGSGTTVALTDALMDLNFAEDAGGGVWVDLGSELELEGTGLWSDNSPDDVFSVGPVQPRAGMCLAHPSGTANTTFSCGDHRCDGGHASGADGRGVEADPDVRPRPTKPGPTSGLPLRSGQRGTSTPRK